MLEETRQYHVGNDGCSPHRMLLGNPTLPGSQRWMLAPSSAKQPQRYQVGSDGCSPHRMLSNPNVTRLAAMDAHPIECFSEPRRYQVGSDGCSPHRMRLGNPTLPGWQRWMLAPSNAFRKPDTTRLATMNARPTECF